MWRRQIERHSIHGDDGNLPTLQLTKGIKQVDRGAAPARKFGNKHRVNLASLRQRHNFASFGTVLLRAGTGLLEYRGNLISGSVSESSQVMLLPLA